MYHKVKKVLSWINPLNWKKKKQLNQDIQSPLEIDESKLKDDQPDLNKTSTNDLDKADQKNTDSINLDEFDQKGTNLTDQKNTDSIDLDKSDQKDSNRLDLEAVSVDSNSTEENPSFVNELSNAIDIISEHCSSMENAVSSDDNIPNLTQNESEHNYGLEIIFVGGTIIVIIATISYIKKKNKNND